jgi:hypothetical protein
MVSAAEQLSSVAGAALVVEGALTLLADDSTGAGSWDEEHAATARTTSPRITQRDLMPRTVCPFITRRDTSAIRADTRALSLVGGGRCWVRTNVGYADGFTDRSLWPLGQPAWGQPPMRIGGGDWQE